MTLETLTDIAARLQQTGEQLAESHRHVETMRRVEQEANQRLTEGHQIAEKIKEVVGSRKCYVTLDIDAMDPAHAGGTGTPAPGGLTSALQREILCPHQQRSPIAFEKAQCFCSRHDRFTDT